MDVISLKEYIFNENKIKYILEKIGCHNIKFNENKDYYSAAQPDGDNLQGVNIRNNEYLSYRSFSRGVDYEDGQDLISLVEKVKNISFIEAIKYLHTLLGLEYKFSKAKKVEKKEDPLDIFKRQVNRKSVNVDDIHLHVLNENVLNEYVPLLHIDWLKEGIIEKTRKKFGLCYSYRYKRVVIPMRYWLTGELLGTNMRTTVENYNEFGIKKYFLTPTYQKNLNIYGLYENRKGIEEAGYVVVYEAEKSVLKRDSLNDATGVALSGHSMSNEQVRILSGLRVEVVIAMDKDVPIEEVWHMCHKFSNYTRVSYIHDTYGKLGDKDSPADASNKDFQFLFDNRIAYDKEKQELYKKSLKKK